jgi:predicted TIM-barrel fold metal-dependent hydrolase
MAIDALCFIGISRFGYELDAEVVLREFDTEGISTAVVAPMHPPHGDMATVNMELARIVRNSGGRFLAAVRVDPWDAAAAVEQVTDAVTEGGARALFLHPDEEHFRINDVRVRPIAERANELRVPVVVATGFHCVSEAVQVGRFAQWCPDVPVIMTNGGQLNISGLGQFDAELALRLPNVHILTSGVYRDDFLERTVKTFGADRVLFASAAPQFDVAYEKRRVHQVHLTDAQRDLLLFGNAERIFGIGEVAR